MKLDETCSCGARLHLEDRSAGGSATVNFEAARFREAHADCRRAASATPFILPSPFPHRGETTSP